MRKELGMWLLVSVCSLGLGGVASADVVSPPPESCPGGSTPNSCHGGPYCAVSGCLNDGACKDGFTCQQLRLCIGEVSCVGMWNPEWGDPPGPEDKVTGSCAEAQACGEGTCQIIAVCAPPVPEPDEDTGGTPPDQNAGSAAAASGSSGDSGCSHGRSTGLGLLVLSGFVFFAYALRRR